MASFLKYRLEAMGVRYHTDRQGNIYAAKGISDTYPCIVAHTDEVHAGHPEGYRVITVENRLLFGYDHINRRHCGIGADDKNGIWICLKCLEEFECLKCAFFVSEETGCVGSGKADMSFFRDCRFVVQCDRRGHSDMVTRAGTTQLCSGRFTRDVSPKDYGYRQTKGMLTDVVALKERGLEVSCINISCGYYYPHTEHEFTDLQDLAKCLAFVRHIIRNCRCVYKHSKNRRRAGKPYTFFDYNIYGCRNRDNSATQERKPFVAEYDEMCLGMDPQDIF